MKQEEINKVVDEVNERARKRLVSAETDTETQKALNVIRKQHLSTKGMSKGGNMRWIGSIPADIYQAQCRIYGENNLKKDKKLFKKVFEPFLLVPKHSI